METQEKPARRLDARRNREAVIEAAMELLTHRPDASMQEIADASGLGRTTVYRHFPAREDLLAAMFDRVVLRAWRLAETVLAEEADAGSTLRRLAGALVDFGAEFGFLVANQRYGQPAFRQSRESPESPVRRYLAEARERGELRQEIPLQWMVSALQSLTIAAIEDESAGHVDAGTAKHLLGQALVDVLVSRRGPGADGSALGN